MSIRALRYAITGEEKMHCEGCENRVRNALQRLDGVLGVITCIEEQRITVSIDTERVRADQVDARLRQIGYKVHTVR